MVLDNETRIAHVYGVNFNQRLLEIFREFWRNFEEFLVVARSKNVVPEDKRKNVEFQMLVAMYHKGDQGQS